MTFSNNNQFIKRDASIMGRWWWTVDHWLLGAILLLVIVGVILSVSASPCVATKIGYNRFFFVKRHLLMIPISIGCMIIVSLFSPQNIRKLAIFIFLLGILALFIVLFGGHEVKGAKRWLVLSGISIQPSEFIKPALLVIVSWLLAERHEDPGFPGIKISLCLLVFTMSLLLLQPDVGMTLVIMISCLVQIFIAGMPFIWVLMSAVFSITGLAISYFFIPHVTKRIDAFFHPELGDPDQLYQIRRSMEAFHHGGWLGCGPGEGVIKRLVPDAHADFVFAVAGEEYGIFLCIFIVCLFAFIVIRSLLLSLRKQNLFIIFSVTGLAVQIGLQTFINMSTALKLIPTKGMTLPFVSYGGSSMIAIGLTLGIILSLTRKQHGLIGDV